MRSLQTFCRGWWRVVFTLVPIASTTIAADRPAGDLVTLRNGAKLRGVLFEQSDKSITLLVSEKWLATTNAKLHPPTRQQNVADHKAGLEHAVRRLKSMQPPFANPAVAAFLTQQLEDVEAELAKADRWEPEFLWFTLSMKEVGRVEAATTEHRKLMAWAWTEQLERSETRSAEDLSREFAARNVSPVGWPMPLIERLSAREQSDDEWAVRLALADYALGKRLDFQGTGNALARAGEEIRPADAGQLLVELLRNQLKSQLGDLLNEGKPARNAFGDDVVRAESLKKAIQIAETENRIGFRVTRLDLVNDFQSAIVTTKFVARVPNGSWRTVFEHTERADAKHARPEIERRIQDDPQVKQVLDLTRQLGLVAEVQIQQAIRFGAATMTAQQICDREFAAFRDVYLPSLVRPPLSVVR